MRIVKYNISINRLKEEDIELVRVQRNSDNIRNFMDYQENISPDMQKKWFQSINNIYNNYFIINYQNEQIGLINGKNSDFEKRTSEGGMFIWDSEYIDSIIPAMCSVIMSDYNFLINGFEYNYIKILKTNLKAIEYNKLLGYELCNDYTSDNHYQWYKLSKENYLKNVSKIRKGIGVATSDYEPLSLDSIDFKDDSNEEIERLYMPLPEFMRKNVDIILKRDKRVFY